MSRKLISVFLALTFLFQQVDLALAGLGELNLAAHFARLQSAVATPAAFRPVHLRYFSYNPDNDTFRILIDKGDKFKDVGSPVNRSTGAPVEELINSPAHRLTGTPITRFTGQPANQSTGTPANRLTGEPANQLQDEAKQLLSYFLIGVSLPNDTFWVNLRPDQPNSIIDPLLEQTDLGRILLEADLNLKQDTARLTSPNTPEGRLYWERLYKKAEELYGSTPAQIPTITRPWIVPGEIIVRETQGVSEYQSVKVSGETQGLPVSQSTGSPVTGTPAHRHTGEPPSAYIYKATLKVMLEEDYLKTQNGSPVNRSTGAPVEEPTNPPANRHTGEPANQFSNSQPYSFPDSRSKALNTYSTKLIKELIIPKLTKEINTSQRYAPLRQVYFSLILSRWFKERFRVQNGAPVNRSAGAPVEEFINQPAHRLTGEPAHQSPGSPAHSYISRIDSSDLTNLTSKTTWSKDTYFQAYKRSFEQGEYSIQEPVYTPTGQVIRSYVSGGMAMQGIDISGLRYSSGSPVVPPGVVKFEGNLNNFSLQASAHEEVASSALTVESIREALHKQMDALNFNVSGGMALLGLIDELEKQAVNPEHIFLSLKVLHLFAVGPVLEIIYGVRKEGKLSTVQEYFQDQERKDAVIGHIRNNIEGYKNIVLSETVAGLTELIEAFYQAKISKSAVAELLGKVISTFESTEPPVSGAQEPEETSEDPYHSDQPELQWGSVSEAIDNLETLLDLDGDMNPRILDDFIEKLQSFQRNQGFANFDDLKTLLTALDALLWGDYLIYIFAGALDNEQERRESLLENLSARYYTFAANDPIVDQLLDLIGVLENSYDTKDGCLGEFNNFGEVVAMLPGDVIRNRAAAAGSEAMPSELLPGRAGSDAGGGTMVSQSAVFIEHMRTEMISRGLRKDVVRQITTELESLSKRLRMATQAVTEVLRVMAKCIWDIQDRRLLSRFSVYEAIKQNLKEIMTTSGLGWITSDIDDISESIAALLCFNLRLYDWRQDAVKELAQTLAALAGEEIRQASKSPVTKPVTAARIISRPDGQAPATEDLAAPEISTQDAQAKIDAVVQRAEEEFGDDVAKALTRAVKSLQSWKLSEQQMLIALGGLCAVIEQDAHTLIINQLEWRATHARLNPNRPSDIIYTKYGYVIVQAVLDGIAKVVKAEGLVDLRTRTASAKILFVLLDSLYLDAEFTKFTELAATLRTVLIADAAAVKAMLSVRPPVEEILPTAPAFEPEAELPERPVVAPGRITLADSSRQRAAMLTLQPKLELYRQIVQKWQAGKNTQGSEKECFSSIRGLEPYFFVIRAEGQKAEKKKVPARSGHPGYKPKKNKRAQPENVGQLGALKIALNRPALDELQQEILDALRQNPTLLKPEVDIDAWENEQRQSGLGLPRQLWDLVNITLAESKSDREGMFGSSALTASDAQLPGDTPGGIDLRALPIQFESVGNFQGLDFSLPLVSGAELFNSSDEVAKLKRMVESGIIPAGERIKECIALCLARGELKKNVDDIILCIAEIFNLQEEQGCCASNAHKEALAIADAYRGTS